MMMKYSDDEKRKHIAFVVRRGNERRNKIEKV